MRGGGWQFFLGLLWILADEMKAGRKIIKNGCDCSWLMTVITATMTKTAYVDCVALADPCFAVARACRRRLIDQLNGQVDFLNEQLALREAQLQEAGEKIHEADEGKLRLMQRCVNSSSSNGMRPSFVP